ncbi:MAG: replication-relaxation family protein [Pirellulaceae bacterium]
MVQQLCCASHTSGRGARKRLSRLRQAGYIVQHRVPVALPDTNGAAPVYYATERAEALAGLHGDDEVSCDQYENTRADRLAHWIAINQTRLWSKRLRLVPMVKLLHWITEWKPAISRRTNPISFIYTPNCRRIHRSRAHLMQAF